MAQRLTLNADSNLLGQLQDLTAKHRPFVSRHRVLRAAVRIGLSALAADPDLLQEVLEAELETPRQTDIEDGGTGPSTQLGDREVAPWR